MNKAFFAIGFGLLVSIATPAKVALADDSPLVLALIGVGPDEKVGINAYLSMSGDGECTFAAELHLRFPSDSGRDTEIRSFEVTDRDRFFTTDLAFVLGREVLRLPVVVELVPLHTTFSGMGRCGVTASWDLRGPKGETRTAVGRTIDFDLAGVFERPVAVSSE